MPTVRVAPLVDWFRQHGWSPAPFQRAAWRAYAQGRSGLLVTPTGSGKTLAALGGPLLQALSDAKTTAETRRKRGEKTPRTRILWVTPLRALAADTARAIQVPLAGLALPWTVAMRTGDASARDRKLARDGQAEVVVITPESLALLLTYPETRTRFSRLQAVVVDEWHELLGNKRGVLLQLCLARLRGWTPGLRVWGLSATLGNLAEAAEVLLPGQQDAVIINAAKPKRVTLETLLPQEGSRFPWAGHLGLAQLAEVTRTLAKAKTTILFTNTRSQAELWHKALSATWLGDDAELALHHGSLDLGIRRAVETGLREGTIRCVVATSSLDLGVDFPAVDQVIQLGSPKGLARVLQRAGRARHQPGQSGHLVCVPTHALELAEFAAARVELQRGGIEARKPLRLSLDVLAQHLVTVALGGGFQPGPMLAEVRSTHAFANLDDDAWDQVLQFVVQGGRALASYPDFCRVVVEPDGTYRVTARRIAYRHRLSVGTITSDGAMQVKMLRGGTLGSLEEQFIARLRPRDRFQFAGRTLELAMVKDMTAYVRPAKRGTGVVPRWQGGRMPMSTELGAAVLRILDEGGNVPEMRALQPLLETQARLSAVPSPTRLLLEVMKTREGWHLFIYPFAGRQAHEALAALLAYRLTQRAPNTIGMAVNDYGLVLTAQAALEIDTELLRELMEPAGILDDLLQGINLAEMAKRQFRDIARVAGLLPPSLPGKAARSLRHLQASSGLLYDVLRQHDGGHVLLAQARREVMEQQLDVSDLRDVLLRIQTLPLDLQRPASLTPLSFPLWAEMLRGQLSSEDWSTRVRRAAEKLEHKHVKTHRIRGQRNQATTVARSRDLPA